MQLLDLTIFYFGIYGMAWSLIYAKPLQPIRQLLTKKSKLLADLLNCIVCTAFWIAIPFTYLYFNTELWFTQTLVLFSTITFTWMLASILED
jgi:hypothetical protein